MMSDQTDLSNYTIRLASSEQEQQYLRATFDVWSKGKSWKDYNEFFEKTLNQGQWTEDGGTKHWVLVLRSDYDGEICSGARVYRRTALLKETSSTEIRDKYIYNVTAVVTPKSKLRRGFARHLLKLLHYELAPPEALPPFPEAEWGPPPPPLSERDRADIPPSLASALWSIVGNFYEKAGYIIQEEHLMQIKWSLRAPTSSEPPPKRSWIYSSDLPAIGAELSEVKRAELSSQQGTSWSIDPSSKGVLSYIPTRVLRPRSQDWNEVYDHEAVGIRLPPIKAGQGEAIVLFSNALSLLPGLLVLYVHNLEADRLPTLLEALDEASVAAGTKEGLLWGLAEDSALSKAWLSQPGREASIARRGDAENQLAVAWYGGHEEKGRVVDSQLWTCA